MPHDHIHFLPCVDSPKPGTLAFTTEIANLKTHLSHLPDDVLSISFYLGPTCRDLSTLTLCQGLYAFATYAGESVMSCTHELIDPVNDMQPRLFDYTKIDGLYCNPRHVEKENEYLDKFGVFVSALLSKFNSNLTGCRRLLLVPHRGLHRVPLIALQISNFKNGDSSRELLSDLFADGIYVVPSLLIHETMSRDASDAGLSRSSLPRGKFVSLTGPGVDCANTVVNYVEASNPFSSVTSDFIRFSATPREYKASSDVSECDILHITAHGEVARPETAINNPGQAVRDTGLLLKTDSNDATSNLPSLPIIQQKQLKRCRLAFITACWGAAGRTDSKSDDGFSIGISFCVAGAKHVMCSLWPVGKISSALIGRRFYENVHRMREGKDCDGLCSISACLLEAQRWYRCIGTANDQANALYPKNSAAHRRMRKFLLKKGAFQNAMDHMSWAGFVVIGPVPQNPQ